MKINSIQQKQNTRQNFRATEYKKISVAVNGTIQEFKMYKMTTRDTDFVSKLLPKIKLPEGLTQPQKAEWRSIIINGSAVNSWFSPRSDIFLLTNKANKPCGIVNGFNGYMNFELDYLATWPVNGQRQKRAGTAMMFSMLEDNNKLPMLVCPSDFVPGNLEEYYKRFGFKKASHSLMLAEPRTIVEKVKELSKSIKSEIIDSDEFVDLSKVLDLEI